MVEQYLADNNNFRGCCLQVNVDKVLSFVVRVPT